MIQNAAGKILSCNITGSVMMRAYLSGMPECKFGINDKLMVVENSTVSRDFTTAGKRTVNFDDCQVTNTLLTPLVPSMRETRQLQHRTHNNIHPTRRRIRAHEVSHHGTHQDTLHLHRDNLANQREHRIQSRCKESLPERITRKRRCDTV